MIVQLLELICYRRAIAVWFIPALHNSLYIHTKKGKFKARICVGISIGISISTHIIRYKRELRFECALQV